MKILLFSDLHVSFRNTEYMRFMEKTMTALWEEAAASDLAINLGDTTDTFGVVDVRDLLFAHSRVRKIGSATRLGQFILRGNHDTGDKAGESSTVPLLQDSQNRAVTFFQSVQFEGMRFIFIPYTSNYEEVYEKLEEQTSAPDAIFAHVDWLGCRLTPQYVSKEGMLPSRIAEIFPDTPVFAGHYHTPMDVGPVHFVGSPQHLNFTDQETSIPRGWIRWDTETKEVHRVANPNTYTCHIVRSEDKRSLKKEIKKFKLPEKTKLKIYVPKKLIEDAVGESQGFLWAGVYPLENSAEDVEFDSKINLTTSPADAVKAAVEKAESSVYDKEMLREFGMKAFNVSRE